MSAEENKTVVRRIMEEVFSKGDLSVVDELVDDEYVDATGGVHGPGGKYGRDGFKQIITGLRAAFPDLQASVDDLIAEGDKVMCRWTTRGTHQGPLGGISPTGKQVTVTGISVYRLANGKIAERWASWDTLGMMEQLGVVARAGQGAR